MARKSQFHIPNTASWKVSKLHIPNIARKSQLHIPNTVSWEVSELHIVHFDCYLHGFVKPWERLQELIPMSRWSQKPRRGGPERLIPMFRCSHKVSVHRSCKANPHGRELGSPELALRLACPGWVLPGPLWPLGEIDILAQSAVNSSNFRACLDSPARNLRFPLYDIMFFAFVV